MDSIAKGECPFCGFTGGNEEIYKHLSQDHMGKDLGDLDRLMLNDTGITHHGLTDEAKEGGLGSGKKDHKGWMRAIEEEHTYDFCENCSMITEQVNHKCDMCGKKVIV